MNSEKETNRVELDVETELRIKQVQNGYIISYAEASDSHLFRVTREVF